MTIEPLLNSNNESVIALRFQHPGEMLNPLEVSATIFLFIFAGAMLGMYLRGIIPEHNLNTETKDLIKLGGGLVGTMAALLLGLLVASAKSSYDTAAAK